MTIEQLKEMIAAGDFHHATYRDHGTLWEGLRIYRKSPTGFQGYVPDGLFAKNDPTLTEALSVISASPVCAVARAMLTVLRLDSEAFNDIYKLVREEARPLLDQRLREIADITARAKAAGITEED